MRLQTNGHGQNGHAKPSATNGGNRLAGVETLGAAPLEPSATAAVEAPNPPAEGRDAGGKFAVGNRHGRGNPHARRMAALRQAFLSAATEERMRELGEKLYSAAAGGDLQAAKLFLLFVVGRPAAAVDPDTLDRDEWLQCQEWPDGPPPFTWLRKIHFAQAVEMAQSMARRDVWGIAPLFPDAANADAQPVTKPEIAAAIQANADA
jgi:hypothetical protein